MRIQRLLTTLTLTVAIGSVCPNAHAAQTYDYIAAFNCNNQTGIAQWINGSMSASFRSPNIAAGTAPSIAQLSDGTIVRAYRGDAGALWVGTSKDNQDFNTGLGVADGTNPSIVALSDGGYEVAFQASGPDHWLWLYGTKNNGNSWLGMMQGTSPSIAALPNGNFEVAFQANNGFLWVVGQTDPARETGYGMRGGTSPSIAAMADGTYEVAFQANDKNLWVYGSKAKGNTGYGMMDGSSPSITAVSNDYEVAFQANDGYLWLVGAKNPGNTGLGMAHGTSPRITQLPDGGYQVAFHAYPAAIGDGLGNLWVTGTGGTVDTTWPMMPGTSPTITALANIRSVVPLAPVGLSMGLGPDTSSSTGASLYWSITLGAAFYKATKTCKGGTLTSQTVYNQHADWTGLPFSTNCTLGVSACNANGTCSSSVSQTLTTNPKPSTVPTTGNIVVHFEIESGLNCGASIVTVDGSSASKALGQFSLTSENGQNLSNPSDGWCQYNYIYPAIPAGAHWVCASWGNYCCKSVTVPKGGSVTASIVPGDCVYTKPTR
jgi:hypothetical protein